MYFFKKIYIFTECKKSFKKGEFFRFRKRISFINCRCSAVNRPTGVIFVLKKSQFNVLSNDIETVKKYEFLVQNRKKKSKNRIFQ